MPRAQTRAAPAAARRQLSLYFKDGRAKVELALAQGRTKGDKRQALAKKDAQRDIDREMGRQRKGKI